MTASKFTPSALVPELFIWGHYQRSSFNEFNQSVKSQVYSEFVPTALADSVINIESRNHLLSGFRLKHTSTNVDSNPFGSFKFQSFVSDNDGTDIFGFDGSYLNVYVPADFNNNRITNVATPVNGTDAANKLYVTSFVSGGTVTLTGNVTGSGTIGTPFATTIQTTLNNIPLATGNVSVNNKKITDLDTPTDGTDAANKSYVDSFASGGTVTLTGNVTGSGIVGTPFATTIQTTLNNIPLATGDVNINNMNLVNVNNIGVGGVSSPAFQAQFPNDLERMKLCLYNILDNSYQSYGFGIQAGALIYNVYNTDAAHVFNCGLSSSSSKELLRVSGDGYTSVANGSGTLYSRTPSAQVQMTTNTTLTNFIANTLKKIAGSTTASGHEVQFTTSSNRITFTGSDLGTACVGMASASVTFYCTAANQTFGICIVKNSSVAVYPYQYNTGVYNGTGYPVNISIPGVLTSLNPSQYLEVWMVCSSTANIKVNALTLSFVAC
jgi:hypothetical protein